MLPASHYTESKAPLTGLSMQGARERLSKQSSLTKTKGFLPSVQCQGARAGTQTIELSSFSLSLLYETGKWFHRVNSVILKCHKLNKLVHIFFFLSQHLNYSHVSKALSKPAVTVPGLFCGHCWPWSTHSPPSAKGGTARAPRGPAQQDW